MILREYQINSVTQAQSTQAMLVSRALPHVRENGVEGSGQHAAAAPDTYLGRDGGRVLASRAPTHGLHHPAAQHRGRDTQSVPSHHLSG